MNDKDPLSRWGMFVILILVCSWAGWREFTIERLENRSEHRYYFPDRTTEPAYTGGKEERLWGTILKLKEDIKDLRDRTGLEESDYVGLQPLFQQIQSAVGDLQQRQRNDEGLREAMLKAAVELERRVKKLEEKKP
jgi:hypothetical protein